MQFFACCRSHTTTMYIGGDNWWMWVQFKVNKLKQFNVVVALIHWYNHHASSLVCPSYWAEDSVVARQGCLNLLQRLSNGCQSIKLMAVKQTNNICHTMCRVCVFLWWNAHRLLVLHFLMQGNNMGQSIVCYFLWCETVRYFVYFFK